MQGTEDAISEPSRAAPTSQIGICPAVTMAAACAVPNGDCCDTPVCSLPSQIQDDDLYAAAVL